MKCGIELGLTLWATPASVLVIRNDINCVSSILVRSMHTSIVTVRDTFGLGIC